MASAVDVLQLCPLGLCPLAIIALLVVVFLAFLVLMYKPLGGGNRLTAVLDVEFHENNPRGRYIWGSADITKDPVIIKPMFAESISVPKSSVVEAVELMSPTNKDVMVFYKKNGILCYFQIKVPRNFDAASTFPGKTRTMDLGLLGYEKHMMNLQLTQGALDDFFGNPDMKIVENKTPAAIFGAGSLYLLDKGGAGSRTVGRINKDDAKIIDQMPFAYKTYSSIAVTGFLEMGLEIFPDALKVSVPFSKGFLLPKASITGIKRTGSRTPMDFLSIYRGGVTISHKVKGAPERISIYLRDVDGLVETLKASGYKVSISS